MIIFANEITLNHTLYSIIMNACMLFPVRSFRRLLTAILFLVFLFTAVAQFPYVRNFGVQDYNGGTQNWGVAETSGRSMLVANNMGLLISDGNGWNRIPVSNNTAVRSVVKNRDGSRFYVGAFDELGYFENSVPLRKSRFISLRSGISVKPGKLKDVWNIIPLPDDTYAFQASNHVLLYSETRNSFRTFYFPGRIEKMWTAAGHLYVATATAVFGMRDGDFHKLYGSEIPAAREVRGGFTSPVDGAPLAMCVSGSLWDLSRSPVRQVEIGGLSDAIRDRNLFTAAESSRWIAIGTVGNGLIAYDRRNGDIHRIDRDNGLSNNTVLSLFPDSDGNIWTGLDNGLAYIVFDSPFRSLFTDNMSPGTGYASLISGDVMYVGTNQGLYSIPVPDEHISYEPQPAEVLGMNFQIWSLAEIDGVILCGSVGGTFFIDSSGVHEIKGVGPSWGFRKIAGADGLVIASLYDGFALLQRDDTGYRLKTNIAGAPEGTANFELDADNDIWVSNWIKGVYRARLSPDFTRVTDIRTFDSKHGLPSDRDNLVTKIGGRVYISAADGFHFQEGSGLHSPLKKAVWLDKIFHTEDIPVRVIETPDGSLWGYRDGWLAYVRRDGKTYLRKILQCKNAVDRLQMNLGNISSLPDGRTVFNQDNGFFAVDGDFTPTPPLKPEIDYAIFIDSREEGTEDFIFRNTGTNYFETSHDRNSMRFSFSMPEYRYADAVTYSSWLEGYENFWTPYSTNHERDFNRLAPGRYTLHLRVHDSFTGQVSHSSVSFRIIPAWYQTWWARTIFVILALIALSLVIKGIERTVAAWRRRRREAELQRQEAERERKRLLEEKESAALLNKDLSNLVKEKTSELASSGIAVKRSADIVADISRELDDIISASGHISDREVAARLKKIRSSIRFHNADDINWEKLDENFNLVFDEMINRLLVHYPNLTRQEIRLCSYLRMNLSTKEIAQLMNVSVRGAESLRFRLRKKLGMPTAQSFQAFFKQLELEDSVIPDKEA